MILADEIGRRGEIVHLAYFLDFMNFPPVYPDGNAVDGRYAVSQFWQNLRTMEGADFDGILSSVICCRVEPARRFLRLYCAKQINVNQAIDIEASWCKVRTPVPHNSIAHHDFVINYGPYRTNMMYPSSSDCARRGVVVPDHLALPYSVRMSWGMFEGFDHYDRRDLRSHREGASPDTFCQKFDVVREIRDWMADNIVGKHCLNVEEKGLQQRFYVMFEEETDAVLFRMRWGA